MGEGEIEEQLDKYPSRLRTYIYDYIYYLILKKINYNFFFHLSKVNIYSKGPIKTILDLLKKIPRWETTTSMHQRNCIQNYRIIKIYGS